MCHVFNRFEIVASADASAEVNNRRMDALAF